MVGFEPHNPADPSDPRIVPLMDLGLVIHNGKTYVAWNVTEALPIHGPRELHQDQYLVRSVLSPDDVRAMAEGLLRFADFAEGKVPPPVPPPGPIRQK
ncbi:MAG TPA: hypothetical protein VGE93_14550 [Bryobacteraceae bacterium]